MYPLLSQKNNPNPSRNVVFVFVIDYKFICQYRDISYEQARARVLGGATPLMARPPDTETTSISMNKNGGESCVNTSHGTANAGGACVINGAHVTADVVDTTPVRGKEIVEAAVIEREGVTIVDMTEDGSEDEDRGRKRGLTPELGEGHQPGAKRPLLITLTPKKWKHL